MTLEELNEGLMGPDDMDAFVQKGLFRDPEFTVKKIGGVVDDPKFTHHMLNFKGPNWFGWIRIVVIGKEWRQQASKWYTVNVFVRRTDGPMFMSQNERSETIVDFGKDYLYGKIKELPAPESLYPYLEAALDEEGQQWAQFTIEGDEDVDKIVYTIGASILHYLKGAKIISEAIDPDEFMSPVIDQGGFRPLKWKLFKGHIARGHENWGHDHWTMHVGSFDEKVFGNVTVSMDVSSPDDAKINDGKVKYEAQFGFSTGSLKQYRNQKAQHKWNVRQAGRAGEEPMVWIPPSHNEAYITMMFRAKPEWAETIKKCFEICVKKDMRPLLDQRDEQGVPMLAQNNKALQEVFQKAFKNHWREASGDTGVTESVIQEVQFDPDEMEAFGEVATDVQYVSPWKKVNGGISGNRFIDVWSVDINVPMDLPSGERITGYIVSYRGTEEPWLLHINVTDGFSKGKYIIGYFKREPTESVLDKVRAAALQQIKSYLAGDDIPGNGINIANQFAANIQSHISGDPEVLMLNYTERTNESIGIDVGDWADEFMKYEGIGPWEKRDVLTSTMMTIQESSICKFKFFDLDGHITFAAFTWHNDNGSDEYIQEIGIRLNDEGTLNVFQTSFASHKTGWTKFRVPDDQFDEAKNELKEFLASYLKPIARRERGRGVLPNFKSAISRRFLNSMAPWFIVREGMEMNPDEIWAEVEKHGGAPLEWKRQPDDRTGGQEMWTMRFPWMDRSHIGVIGITRAPEMGPDVYLAMINIQARDDEFGGLLTGGTYYEEEISDSKMVRLDTPQKMANFQQGSIDLALKLMSIYNDGNRIRTSSPANGRETDEFIRHEWNMLVDFIDLRVREALIEPDEFIKGFDVQGVMKPWKKVEYLNEPRPHIAWFTTIEHRDTTRPFNDKLELTVDWHLPTQEEGGMPHQQFSLISGTYHHKGWSAKVLNTIYVDHGKGEDVVKIVDNVVRSLVVKKIARNESTPGSISYFLRALRKSLRDHGLTESQIRGQSGNKLTPHGKYWLDRDCVFHYVDDHEDAVAWLPPDWEKNYSHVDLDAVYLEANKLGYVRVVVDESVMFNPPATDKQVAALVEAAKERAIPCIADYGKRQQTVWAPDTYEIKESIPGLTFRSECRGAHHGQADMTLFAEIDGQAVGRIEYSVFDDQPQVQWIKVQPAYRRKGIATAMAKQLQSEYPGTEIEWSNSTEMGTPFIASLNRDFTPTPNYDMMKKAYDDAKAEREALQREFDAWTAAGKGRLPREMLLKGERMNEIETFLWDMEDKLRDLKPGKWIIKETESPEDFYAGFEQAHAVTGWIGHDQNTSTGAGSYLHVNKSGILGPFGFNVYLRPQGRNYLSLDCSFHLSSWSSKPDGSFTQEAPDIWLRLSPTKGRPSFQPGNIDDFTTGLKAALEDIAPKIMPQKGIATTGLAMFNAMRSWIVKAGWQIDVDKHGKAWDLVHTGVGESLQEGVDWSPEEIADLANKATECWGEWQIMPYNGAYDQKGEDRLFHIHAPYGKLYPENNYIRVRFYEQEPGENYILGNLEAHYVAPLFRDSVPTVRAASNYDHIDISNQFVVPPGTQDEFCKSVEAEFKRTIGKAVETTPRYGFALRDMERKVKAGFTKLVRKWWVPGVTWGLR